MTEATERFQTRLCVCLWGGGQGGGLGLIVKAKVYFRIFQNGVFLCSFGETKLFAISAVVQYLMFP